MQHLWSAATWEVRVNEESSDDSTIGLPVTILSLDIVGKRKVGQSQPPVHNVALDRDLYLLTAWYVHDFLDKLYISLTDPNGRQLWYTEAKSRSKGILTKAVHILPIRDLRYSVDGLYTFYFHFGNDEGRNSETGSFRIVLNRSGRR